MKKLIHIVLMIGLISACTKSSVQYEQTGEISFRPVTAMTTKVAVSGTVYPKDSIFTVWAWWGDTPENTPLEGFPAVAEMYLNKRPFANREKTGNSWEGMDIPYFWPTRGSLVFAGYSPVSATAQNFSYSWSEKTMTITAYEQSADISKTVDLMWFDVTGCSYTDNEGDGVPVVFKHLLSWLTFKFKKQDASSSYFVTDVTLLGIETKARFTSRPAAGSEEWSDQTEQKAVAVWTGSKAVPETEPMELESTNGGVLVIPQPCTAEHVQLQVKYKTSEGGAEQTKDVYLTAGTDGHIWKPGKHYTYTITFSNDEILVLPDVTDWQTVSEDIEVQ